MTSDATGKDMGLNLSATFNAISERTITAFVARTLEDFPAFRNRFSVYCFPTKKLYGSFADEKDKENLLFWQAPNESEEDSEEAFSQCAPNWEHNKTGNYYAEDYFAITYKIEVDNAAKMQAALEHELGHFVAPGGKLYKGIKHGIFQENVAEVFSHLRQHQISQTGQINIERDCFKTSEYLVYDGNVSHFDLPVLQELKRLVTIYGPQCMDLSPQETGNLAYRLSLLYVPPEKDLKKLAEVFTAVQLPVDEALEMDDMKKVAEIIFEDYREISPLIFMTVKNYFEPMLNKHVDILNGWTAEDLQAFSGPYWDNFHEKLKERTLQEETKTLEQRLAHEARDMMVFGRFDKEPDKIIDPEVYESKENMAYLQRARDAYTALLYLQETGTPMSGKNTAPISAEKATSLDKNQIIALACKIAENPAPIAPSAPPAQIYSRRAIARARIQQRRNRR